MEASRMQGGVAAVGGVPHPYTEHVNPHLGALLEQLALDKVFVRGEGCYLHDRDGRRYLDFLSQYGALPFGFNPPEIWAALRAVQERLEPSFVQPSYLEAASELARTLVRVAPEGLRHVTYGNSGAEAIEAAIKLCRSTTGRSGVLSTTNGFHGKTLGALSATPKKKYQARFGAPVDGFTHVAFGDVGALERALREKRYAAFLVEPIQGEGGIVEAPPGYLAAARALCDETGTLLVVDEIQTGLGRTGRMFASEAEGITPDVMTVAKALGGGLLAIGACLCTPGAYNDHFALKHTSTFAGNTLACRVGLATLGLLERDGRALVRQVDENGRRLKQRLVELHQRYPHIIAGVSGRGYMLGVRFDIDRHEWGQGLIGALGDTEVLTSLVVSHMLNVGGVRVGYTLNHGGVLRVEPPLVATWADCEAFLEGFENSLRALDQKHVARFTAHVTGWREEQGAGHEPERPRPVARFVCGEKSGRFAFLLHPLTARNYADVDPGLRLLTDRQVQRLARCVADNFDPFVIGQAFVRSATGATAYGDFVMIARTAEELLAMPPADALEEMRKAVAIAQEAGARIVGLGAYVSVVTKGGLYLKVDGAPALTTGNSYTASAARQAAQAVLAAQGQELTGRAVAVVGASGSIGRALAIMLAPQVGRLVLVGNPEHAVQGARRLAEVTGDVLRSLWERRAAGESTGALGGLLGFVADDAAGWTRRDWARAAERALRESHLIRPSYDVPAALHEADLVVTATNNVKPLVHPQDLPRGCVVCDVSRPTNVAAGVGERRPDVRVVDGGVVRLPRGSELNFTIDLPPGQVYACMAETMLLALEGRYEDSGLGLDLDLRRVLEMEALARRHGFEVVAPQARAAGDAAVRAACA